MARNGVKTGGGSRKGVPNRATQAAREAIGMFVDNNAGRLQGWLDQIANGVQDPDTKEYVVAPNPEKAFQLFQSVIEYHVPKLARTDTTLSGPDGGPVVINAIINGVPVGTKRPA